MWFKARVLSLNGCNLLADPFPDGPAMLLARFSHLATSRSKMCDDLGRFEFSNLLGLCSAVDNLSLGVHFHGAEAAGEDNTIDGPGRGSTRRGGGRSDRAREMSESS